MEFPLKSISQIDITRNKLYILGGRVGIMNKNNNKGGLKYGMV